MLTPVGPAAPPSLRAALTSMQDALRALQTPGEPTPLLAVAQAKLPPAASYPQRLLLVSDLNVLAHSDGAHWRRADTGAEID